MTPDEQWTAINVPGADQAIWNKVQTVRAAMASADVEAESWRTKLNDVPILVRENGEFIDIDVGTDADGKPQVALHIPKVWLEA